MSDHRPDLPPAEPPPPWAPSPSPGDRLAAGVCTWPEDGGCDGPQMFTALMTAYTFGHKLCHGHAVQAEGKGYVVSPMSAEVDGDRGWAGLSPHRYDVDTIDGAPCCPFDRGHPIHRQPELPPVPETLGPDRQQDLDRGYAPEAEGCELCSYTPGGCSFCSGRSAIEVANERSDVAGVPVVDLTDVVDFQRRMLEDAHVDDHVVDDQRDEADS